MGSSMPKPLVQPIPVFLRQRVCLQVPEIDHHRIEGAVSGEGVEGVLRQLLRPVPLPPGEEEIQVADLFRGELPPTAMNTAGSDVELWGIPQLIAHLRERLIRPDLLFRLWT